MKNELVRSGVACLHGYKLRLHKLGLTAAEYLHDQDITHFYLLDAVGDVLRDLIEFPHHDLKVLRRAACSACALQSAPGGAVW